MYNDYYLQLINGNLEETNEYLEEIKEQNQNIISLQQTLISGDIEIQRLQQENIKTGQLIPVCIILYIITYYVVRCLK